MSMHYLMANVYKIGVVSEYKPSLKEINSLYSTNMNIPSSRTFRSYSVDVVSQMLYLHLSIVGII
jgi:hypothetical protein